MAVNYGTLSNSKPETGIQSSSGSRFYQNTRIRVSKLMYDQEVLAISIAQVAINDGQDFLVMQYDHKCPPPSSKHLERSVVENGSPFTS